MHEDSIIPQPLPEIPRGPLWVLLGIPPVLTLVSNMAIGISDINGVGFVFALLFPSITFFVILGNSIKFNYLMKQRYRGRSLLFLSSAYFLGEIIVCLALWIGNYILFL